jgi:cell wall-associated NlpC family hydrolase
LRRFILSGIFVFVLSLGAVGIAAADETVAAAPAAAAATIAVQEAAAQAAAAHVAESAAPTDGADLAMWNAPAPKEEKHLSPVRRFASGIFARTSAIAKNLTRSAMRFIGTPYVFGGTSRGGFDCSGYVQHVFAMIGIHLPRTADAQYDAGKRIAAAHMAPGDLVFFHTYAPGVSHVGIYLGNDQFIHSSSSHGVTISSLHESYWAARYVGAKRVVAAN